MSARSVTVHNPPLPTSTRDPHHQFLYGQAITGAAIFEARLIDPPRTIDDERWVHETLALFLAPDATITRTYEETR